jgi:hypothetical protein
MAVRRLPAIKVRKVRTPRAILPAPFRPVTDNSNDAEVLAGEVQGMKASAPEERLFKALRRRPKVRDMKFRYAVGAPRGLPGWKECDFVVEAFGIVYAIEVDTKFTHRGKGESDRLHDAILLNALRSEGLSVYPTVIHLDGDSELADQKNADATAERMF